MGKQKHMTYLVEVEIALYWLCVCILARMVGVNELLVNENFLPFSTFDTIIFFMLPAESDTILLSFIFAF